MPKKIIKLTFKRRRQGKTDYKARKIMLKAKEPRLVIRKTNKYIMAQIIKSKEAKDFTVCYANSKELSKFGWNLSFKNIPAAYLTGLLIAKKAKEKAIDKVIVDIGFYRSTKGSRFYAVVKGAIDGGLKIKCDPKIMPSDERIKGLHVKNTEKLNQIFTEIRAKIRQ